MAGIFDRMNHPGTGENERTLAPPFLDGVLLMYVSGVRNAQQLLAEINAALSPSPPLDAAAQQDLSDIAAYIQAGTGEAGKIARLHRIQAVAGIWETGLAGITEAEARTMMGVTFTK